MDIFSYKIYVHIQISAVVYIIMFASYSVMLSVNSFMYIAKKFGLIHPISWLPQLHTNLICFFMVSQFVILIYSIEMLCLQ